MLERILVPCDGTERTAPALAAATTLAALSGGTVVALCPAAGQEPAPPAADDPLHAARHEALALAQDAQAYARRCASEHGAHVDTVECADPDDPQAIVDAARACDCGLIVVGAVHHRRLLGRLLGDPAWKLMDGCGIPVLVVPAPEEGPS